MYSESRSYSAQLGQRDAVIYSTLYTDLILIDLSVQRAYVAEKGKAVAQNDTNSEISIRTCTKTHNGILPMTHSSEEGCYFVCVCAD